MPKQHKMANSEKATGLRADIQQLASAIHEARGAISILSEMLDKAQVELSSNSNVDAESNFNKCSDLTVECDKQESLLQDFYAQYFDKIQHYKEE
ncbi:MAG: hypothetical protein MMC23_008590 [Stictis urceolatum]|nr:hypothetical protein [Stictis urceolata]